MTIHPALPLIAYSISQGSHLLIAEPTLSSPVDWVSTLGPFSVAIGLSYLLLRRSDAREAVAEESHMRREERLREDLHRCQEDKAVLQAETARLEAIIRNHDEAT